MKKRRCGIILGLLLFAAMCLVACGSGGESYAVSFETNGGSAVAAVTVLKGESLNLPEPSKAEFDFAGWFPSADLSGNRLSSPYTPEGSITLYAKWTEKKRPFSKAIA